MHTNKIIKYIAILFISVLTFSLTDINYADAKPKKAKVTNSKRAKPIKAVKGKSAKNSKIKTKATKRTKIGNKAKILTPPAPKINANSESETIFLDTVATGVVYKKVLIGNSKNRIAAHVIEADITNPENHIGVLKAKNQITELEKLQEICRAYDSLHYDRPCLAAINANFWRAGSNFPIGPVVCNGEVVELNSYKNWSTGMFDSRNRLYIDRFSITAYISSNKGLFQIIDNVNHRSDSNQIVIYNQYGGDSIPYVSPRKLSYQLEAALMGLEDKDTSDIEVDTIEIKRMLQTERRMGTIEYSMPKLTLKYLTPPGINKKIRCVVQSLDTFTVKTSSKTCILSIGKNFPNYKIPKIGDTLILKFETNAYQGIVFQNAVSGTPRLVRNGVANHEAEVEGSRSRRFIGAALPRSAIGIDKDMSKVYLVVTEATNVTKETKGADLAEMAQLMKLIGCYNAMNLDGGGSSILSMNGRNQINSENPDACRKLSVGVGVIKKMKNKYHREAEKVIIE